MGFLTSDPHRYVMSSLVILHTIKSLKTFPKRKRLFSLSILSTMVREKKDGTKVCITDLDVSGIVLVLWSTYFFLGYLIVPIVRVIVDSRPSDGYRRKEV